MPLTITEFADRLKPETEKNMPEAIEYKEKPPRVSLKREAKVDLNSLNESKRFKVETEIKQTF